MLEGHRKLILQTTVNDPIEVEVNFSKNPAINDCKILRFTRGKDTWDIDREKLVSLLMLIGTEGNQKNLMPIKFGTVRKLERLLTFEWTASRDFRKGEKITVQAPWIDEIPTEEEMMGGQLKRKFKANPNDGVHKNSFLISK